MLFQSDYWLASNTHEMTETLHDFLDTDSGITTLVIVNKNHTNIVETILQDLLTNTEFECNIKLISGVSTQSYGSDSSAHLKTIYVYTELDMTAISLMKMHQPIFAIFV